MTKITPAQKRVASKVCPSCFAGHPIAVRVCVWCDHHFIPKKRVAAEEARITSELAAAIEKELARD